MLPNKLTILGIPYRVKLLSAKKMAELRDGQPGLGLASCFTQTIYINRDAAKEQQQQTLWHEVIHILMMELTPTAHCEDTVAAVAAGIYEVLRSRPGLVWW